VNARPLHLRFVAAALLLAAFLSLAASATATPPATPLDLRVAGGEGWQADNDFRLDWRNPDPATVAAVRYRVSYLAGTVVLSSRLPWETDRVEDIHVPAPGRYRAEVWLESAIGEQGPVAAASLRFDDVSPAAIGLSLPDEWIGGDKQPLLRLNYPAAPLPLSGIRGYAIVAGPAPIHPCTAPDRCTEAETDLAAGVSDDSLLLPDLPEGAVHVRAVAVSGAGVAGPAASGIVHVDRTPPVLTLAGAPDRWVSRAVTVAAGARDELSGMTGGGASIGITVDGGAPAVVSGDSVSVTVSAEGVHFIAAHARDAAGNSGGAASTTIRIDRTPPRVAFATVLDPADPELLSARVADRLSGPDPARGSIGVRPRGSRRQFAPLPTAVAGDRLLARWDSDRYPPGLYEFQATAYDSAGNAAATQLRADGAKLVLPAPLKVATRLLAGFGARQLPARTIGFGKRVTVSGALGDAGGGALAGLPLLVTERFGDGSATRRHELRTGRGGSFALRVQPGPGRRIELGFAGTRTLAATSAGALELKVRTGVSMRASAASARIGGRPLIFSGSVADRAAIPADGKSVELQFKLPGLPWTQFRTVRTDPRGRFRYPYRFSDDDSRGVRFGFRAFVPAEPGWPYEPAASRPVFVTGR
jgi:hypothetical protein